MTDPGTDVVHRKAGGSRVARALGLLGWIELAITVAAFTSVIVLVSTQIFFRYVFDVGLVWVQEVSQLLILTAYFFGISFVFKSRRYLIVSILFDRFPEAAKLPLYIGCQVLTAAFCAMLFLELLSIAPQQLYMKTYILHIPRFYSSLPLLIASISMTLTAVYYTVEAIRMRSAGDLDTIEEAIDLFPGDRSGYSL